MGRIKKSGIAVLDLVFALAVLALIAVLAVPNVGRLMPGYKRRQFLSSVETVVNIGWQQALVTRSIHKVLFDLQEGIIVLERATDNLNQKGELEFTRAQVSGVLTRCEIPPFIEIKQFFIEGFDEIARYQGNKNAARVWFFLVPEGMAQKVVINMFDNGSKDEKGNPRSIGLVLNPLTARFYVYDEFQKP
ncbi:hypothetical protein IPH25_02185 [bacterium]|nr:MAG: hypothetical protein IPG37_04320 [bacterium]QQR62232.1 MAG: hypothetical protein IPH25_02185 [bacterium]